MLRKLKVYYYYLISYWSLDIAIEYNKSIPKVAQKALDCYDEERVEEGNYYYKLYLKCKSKVDEYDKKSQEYFNKFLASRKALKDV